MDLLNGLYIEHLEEISSIYERWLWIREDCRGNGFDFQETENQLEAHIEALVEDDVALWVCEQRAVEGDFGECYGACRVLLRRSKFDGLERLINEVDGLDLKKVKGIADAICHEPGQETDHWLEGDFFRGLLAQDSCRVRMAAQVCGFYRIDVSTELIEVLDRLSEDQETILDILSALGRIRPVFGALRLLGFLENPDARIVDAAIAALVRIGDRYALKQCMAVVAPRDWPALPLGLYGDKDALTETLLEPRRVLSPDHMIAAGIIGDVSFVATLANSLDNPVLAESAALALHLITGMAFYEDYFIPEVASEDDLFTDEEKDAWRNGTLYPDGKIPGHTATRLSQNQDLWWDWYQKNIDHFNPEQRHRLGQPSSPSTLFDQMKSPITPDFIRQLAHEELVIRYNLDLPFETTMTVAQQSHAMESHTRMIEGSRSVFACGDWYYNANPMDNNTQTEKKETHP